MNTPALSSIRRDERGMGLLFGLMCAAIVGVITWAMMTNGLVDMTIADNYRAKSTAFYAADAGIEQTLIDLKVDDAWISTFVDVDSWQLKTVIPDTITINGHTITLEFDGDGNVVPRYYPVGTPTTVGDGTYVRELYLPPVVAPGDCSLVDDPEAESGEGSGSDSGGSAGSGGSSTGSGSGGSSSAAGSGSGGDDFFSSAAETLGSLAGRAGLALAPMSWAMEKVDICHVPPGNPGNAHTINISSSATTAHLAHGDTEGACAETSGSGSGSGGSGSGGSGSDISADVYPYDPCDLLQDLGSGSSGGSGSEGSGASGSSAGSGSTSGSGGSSGSGSGSDGGFDGLAAMVDGGHGAASRGLLLAGASFAVAPKVKTCHVPPGNPGNAHTISVGSAAVGAHLSNHEGDAIGACADDDASSSGGSGSGGSSDPCDASGSSGGSGSGSSGGSGSGSSAGSASGGSGSSGSGGSAGSGSGASGSTCDDQGGDAEDDSDESVSSYVIFKVRSTGTGGLTEQSSQVILAELAFLLGTDENLYDIAIQNWKRER